ARVDPVAADDHVPMAAVVADTDPGPVRIRTYAVEAVVEVVLLDQAEVVGDAEPGGVEDDAAPQRVAPRLHGPVGAVAVDDAVLDDLVGGDADVAGVDGAADLAVADDHAGPQVVPAAVAEEVHAAGDAQVLDDLVVRHRVDAGHGLLRLPPVGQADQRRGGHLRAVGDLCRLFLLRVAPRVRPAVGDVVQQRRVRRRRGDE